MSTTSESPTRAKRLRIVLIVAAFLVLASVRTVAHALGASDDTASTVSTAAIGIVAGAAALMASRAGWYRRFADERTQAYSRLAADGAAAWMLLACLLALFHASDRGRPMTPYLLIIAAGAAGAVFALVGERIRNRPRGRA